MADFSVRARKIQDESETPHARSEKISQRIMEICIKIMA